MQYKAFDIAYDTDGENVDLPKEMTLDLEDGAEPSLELADLISDRTGFCVEAFRFGPTSSSSTSRPQASTPAHTHSRSAGATTP